MLYHCFKELKEDYKTIILSVTELEKALVPTPSFVTELEPKKKANTYWVWNLVENIVFARINQWVEAAQHQIEITRQMMNPERMRYFSPSWVEDRQFKRVYDWLEKIVESAWQYEAIWLYDIRNLRSMAEIDFSWFKVILSGEIDFWFDGQALFDCKSSKKKWNEKEKRERECFQGRFYPWFQFLAHPEIEDISFSYLIWTKQATPQHQNITKIVTREEADNFVKDKLYQYLLKVHNGEIETTEGSLDRM